MTIELIAELQLGKTGGVRQQRLGEARQSLTFEHQFKTQPLVCLACTELAACVSGA